MPATEQTWRDQKLMHIIFAVSSVLLLISTVWMLAVDHARPWKPYQKNARSIDIATTAWRDLQYQAIDHQAKLDRLNVALAEIRGRGVDANNLLEFRRELGDKVDSEEGGDSSGLGAIGDSLKAETTKANSARATYNQQVILVAQKGDALRTADEALTAASDALDAAEDSAKAAAQTQLDAAQAKRTVAQTAYDDENAKLAGMLDGAIEAEAASAAVRKRLLARAASFVLAAKNRMENKSVKRKAASAQLDVAKANVGLGIRDSLGPDAMEGLADEVKKKQREYRRLNLEWERLSTTYTNLNDLIGKMEAGEEELLKELEEANAGSVRIANALIEKRSNYFEMYGVMPVPGKKWLELPILTAFNSPLKIDNLWHEDLVQDYNFLKVRRFDRCTTCHRMMDKTAPGDATEPAYVRDRSVELLLSGAVEEGVDKTAAELAAALLKSKKLTREPTSTDYVEAFFGVQFASEGLLDSGDLTIAYTKPKSRGAKAALLSAAAATLPGDAILTLPLQPNSKIAPSKDDKPGFEPGDVITNIDGDPVESAQRAIHRLRDAALDGQSLTITVRRGLPNPYVSHPRLDLFVGSLSPHPQAVFACTVCHEGQGSATEFKWSSHAPDSSKDMARWKQDLGWFDNHHWIYPMYPKRFMESGCLKCHHNVTELEKSERYAEAPAPKVTKGHQLIKKYGCYGCHEFNGYDSGDRVGPDLRSEPNYFAAAQQIKFDPGFAKLTDLEKQYVDDLIGQPGRDDVRRKLYQVLLQDESSSERRLSEDTLTRIAPLLKDIENPGKLRRAGPSLRFVGSKLDSAFLYDWIRKPKHFRPTSRMPQFFGLWNHLEGESLKTAKRLEAIEIFAAVKYLENRSQPFEYLPFEKNVDPPSSARGKTAFQLRCVACHSHKDFPDVAEYRAKDKIQQGPDLSGLSGKFDKRRNTNARAWMYTWLKEPNRYHVRTVMPNAVLDPLETKDAEGAVTRTDPAADIVEYLLSEKTDYQPAEGTIVDPTPDQLAVLDELVHGNLLDAFYTDEAARFAKQGIPEEMRGDLKGAEVELLVPNEQYESGSSVLPQQQKLMYVGKKVIAKYGCYGCHDIPGFEQAKPIGAGLAEWGKKEPSKLAFEHIQEFLGHGSHGHGADHGSDDDGHAGNSTIQPNEVPSFYKDQLNAGNRIGFIYQKLAEPRSYDYHKTEYKKYNEKLRMPKFPFDDGDREAVITFVLGLFADPPPAKYVYKPSPREQAIQEGKEVLAKYNCGGCHLLETERWDIAFEPETYGEQSLDELYPFVPKRFLPDTKTTSETPDRRNLIRATLRGMPTLNNDGVAMMFDEYGDDVLQEDDYNPYSLTYLMQLWEPTLVEGQPFQVGGLPLEVPSSSIERRLPSEGGDLAKYLLPHVRDLEAQVNPNAKGSEAWAWVPPPLVGEGVKVQTDWLHEFLLDPHPIRPAVFMRMPKFAMSPEEATKLVNYFAAKDNVEYPYEYERRQGDDHLAKADASYAEKLKAAGAEGTRFGDAMKMVTSQDYCVKCHIVGDFDPTSSDRAKAPDLAKVYRRLRPDYTRKWIAMPSSVLPYTAMPVNVKYDPNAPNLGTEIPQDLYHGNSIEQVDALVDLLMNFDKYAKSRSLIAPLVKPAKTETPAQGEQ